MEKNIVIWPSILRLKKKLIYKRDRMKLLVFLAICKNTLTQVDI